MRNHVSTKPAASIGILLAAFLFALAPMSMEAAQRPSNVSLVPTITSIVASNGQLLASGNATVVVRGATNVVAFTGVPVTLALATNQPAGATCPVLDLTLAPITLDVLGLVVETSPICLQITAYENGGLLGSLLCSVANLLNGGLSLNQILAGQGLLNTVTGLIQIPGLTGGELTTLLGGVQSLLNGALGNLLNSVITAVTDGHGQVCSVLHLELGPVNLTLLGLNVVLDDCANGPVVVDITAHHGNGALLGNLLCSLLNSGQAGGLGATLQNLLTGLLGRL